MSKMGTIFRNQPFVDGKRTVDDKTIVVFAPLGFRGQNRGACDQAIDDRKQC
jgi:hypothetical protein